MEAIHIQNLTKYYGKVKALENVSLKISRSEVFGLIGPNGAGKTTLIKILAGLLYPSEGNITICGLQPYKNTLQVKRIMSVVLDQPVFLEHLKVKEFIHLMCRLYEVSNQELVNTYINRWGLDKHYNKQLCFLSRGLRKRVSIVSALIRSFQIVILDEPFNELDIEARFLLNEEIKKIQNEGKTALITSHDLFQIEKICTRVGILKNGHLLLNVPMEKIKETLDESVKIKNFEDLVAGLFFNEKISN